MVVLGLTGSIGMGKTTAAETLRLLNVPVHDSDACVHALLARGGGAAAAVAEAFPDCAPGGVPDRARLAKRVFEDAGALKRLEAILHPLVRRAERRFLAHARARRLPVVALDIPLLFETGAENRCTAVIVVTAPAFVQERRVLGRPGMTAARFQAIRARQMPDALKRQRADYIVATGLGRGTSFRALRRIIETVQKKQRARRS